MTINVKNLVIRAIVTYSDGSKQPITVKVTRSAAYDPKAKDALRTSGLLREWAATALLKPWADNGMLVSQFPGGDTGLGLIITHDLGSELPSLVEPLMGGKPGHAEKVILEYAAALGNMHAKTIGRSPIFAFKALTSASSTTGSFVDELRSKSSDAPFCLLRKST